MTGMLQDLRYALSQSGTFWPRRERDNPQHERFTRQFASSPKQPIRFVLQVGVLETEQTPVNGPSILLTNRHLRDVKRVRESIAARLRADTSPSSGEAG